MSLDAYAKTQIGSLQRKIDKAIKYHAERGDIRCEFCALAKQACHTCWTLDTAGRKPLEPTLQVMEMKVK